MEYEIGLYEDNIVLLYPKPDKGWGWEYSNESHPRERGIFHDCRNDLGRSAFDTFDSSEEFPKVDTSTRECEHCGKKLEAFWINVLLMGEL